MGMPSEATDIKVGAIIDTAAECCYHDHCREHDVDHGTRFMALRSLEAYLCVRSSRLTAAVATATASAYSCLMSLLQRRM
jgi:hypothetical protein